ncbi:MAG: hypothetical protein IJW59_04815 [Clostridia bacterium]|nr:hypothetical protein [Clostridia bacterium]
MKKIRVVQFVGIVLFVAYIGLIITDAILDFLADYRLIIFSILLSIISLNLIVKGAILKSSSTLWFANCLILSSFIIVLLDLCQVQISEYYLLFVLIPFISSLINLAIFQNLIYIKIIILNIFIAVPLVFDYFFDFRQWVLWVAVAGCLVVGFLICRSINVDKENV